MKKHKSKKCSLFSYPEVKKCQSEENVDFLY